MLFSLYRHKISSYIVKNTTNMGKTPWTKNAFLLSLHGMLLVMTSIPFLLQLNAWGQPGVSIELSKTFELPLYALTMGAILLWTLVAQKRCHTFVSKDWPSYQTFLAFLVPLTVLIHGTASVLPPFLKTILFVFLIAGFALPWLETRPNLRFFDHRLRHRSNSILMVSACATVILIVTRSIGNTFALFSPLAICLFLALAAMLYMPTRRNHASLFVCAIAIISILLIAANTEVDLHHYSYFLGPVLEFLYGHKHPLVNINTQYGGGITIFLALCFKILGSVSSDSMILFLKIGTFLQSVLLALIAFALYGSRRVAFATALSVLLYVYCSQAQAYFWYPSIGFLRFGVGLLLLALYCLPPHSLAKKNRTLMTALLAAIGTLLSFESFVYTVPAFFLAEWYGGTLRRAVVWYGGFLCGLGFLYILPPLLHGETLELSHYYEYSALYAGGFGEISLERGISFWWFFPLVYIGAWTAALCHRHAGDEKIIFLSIYGLSIFTYFVGRAHPNNLHHIAIPFILLGTWLAWTRCGSMRRIATAAFLTIILSANFSYFTEGRILDSVLPKTKEGLAIIMMQATSVTHASTEAPEHAADCHETYAPLIPYLDATSIALVDEDDGNYPLYDCLHISNALDVNPYSATDINPAARERTLRLADIFPQFHFLLIEDTTMQRDFAKEILERSHARWMSSFDLHGKTMHVFFKH